MTAGSGTDLELVRAEASAWLEAEPDEDLRAELQALLDGPADELLARFSGRLRDLTGQSLPISLASRVCVLLRGSW